MFNREYAKGSWLLVGFIVGAAMALVMVPVIARTAALAAPASLFAWFTGHGLAGVGSFLWSVLVVYGLSIALPAAALLLVLFRLSPSGRTALGMWLGIGVLFRRMWGCRSIRVSQAFRSLCCRGGSKGLPHRCCWGWGSR